MDCVRAIAAAGATHVYECGPGKVLASLSKRIVPGLEGLALADRAGIDQGLQLFRKA
jgi:[acyl-carrier-protein] S-malonyltransferase